MASKVYSYRFGVLHVSERVCIRSFAPQIALDMIIVILKSYIDKKQKVTLGTWYGRVAIMEVKTRKCTDRETLAYKRKQWTTLDNQYKRKLRYRSSLQRELARIEQIIAKPEPVKTKKQLKLEAEIAELKARTVRQSTSESE